MFIRREKKGEKKKKKKESGNFISRRAFPYRRKKFDTDKKVKKFKSNRSTRYSRLRNIGRIMVGGGKGQPV